MISVLRNRSRRVADTCLAAAWVINGLLLAGGFVFVYRFSASRDVIQRVEHSFAAGEWRTNSNYDGGTYFLCMLTNIAAAVGAGTLLAALVGLVSGGPRFRSTRMWLLFTAVVAGWLGLGVAWPEIYWLGQERRISAVLASAETTVRDLNAHWPRDDGELRSVGQFLAYPKGRPATLLALGAARFPDSNLCFSAIERSGNDVMRFYLTGDESDAWLEWRGDDSVPDSFKGGLDTRYVVERQRRLAPRWFLVRYRAAGLVTGD